MKTKLNALALMFVLVFTACSDDDDSNNANNTNNQNNVNNSNNQNNSNNSNNVNNVNNSNNSNNANNVMDPDPTCDNYCDLVMQNCADENAQYTSRQECMDYCGSVAGWDTGTKGETDTNTIACRIYHSNLPAADNPGVHCVHAGPTGGNFCGTWCDNYCQLAQKNCTGDNSLYNNDGECETACGGFNATGQAGDTTFDTVQCRIYHAGAPALGQPELHCPHAAEEPTSECVLLPDTFVFRTDMPSTYTRVDRAGMPAINTVVITSKDDYNAADPVDDAAGDFVDEIVASIGVLHNALDDDLTGLSLTPCTTGANGTCVTQAGPAVIPDHITIDTSTNPGFPNGRRLPDPVIDMTLSLILLDQTAHDLNTLLGTNPEENDLGVEGAFLTSFPYLHPPHEP